MSNNIKMVRHATYDDGEPVFMAFSEPFGYENPVTRPLRVLGSLSICENGKMAYATFIEDSRTLGCVWIDELNVIWLFNEMADYVHPRRK